MLGMNAYHKFKELEETCAELGFSMTKSRDYSIGNGFDDLICLVPDGDALPAFSRDCVIYRDDLDGCLTFLHGWRQSRFYLEIIGVTKKGVVEKAERKHLEALESARTIYALQQGKDPGDLRSKRNRLKFEEDGHTVFDV